MTIEIVDIADPAGAFEVKGANGAPLHDDEQAYAEAVARVVESAVTDAAEDPADADPLSEAERKLRRQERSAFFADLRQQAEKVVAGTCTPDEAADHAFVQRGWYLANQARRSERLFKVYEDRDSNGIPTDIIISVSTEGVIGPTTPTEEQQALFVAIENARTVVSTVASRIESGQGGLLGGGVGEARSKERADAIRKRFLQGLAEIAKVGLEGPHSQLAKAALDTLKSEFVANEAGRIKNGYVVALGKAAAVAAAICLALHFTLVQLDVDNPLFRYRVFFAAAAGAAVGTWLSFSIRRVTLTFEELAVIEEDLLDPGLRIVFVLLLTIVVLLLFWTGVMNIEIGQLKTGDLRNARTGLPMGSIAFLIGSFCGMAERALATAMSGRAAAFVRTLST